MNLLRPCTSFTERRRRSLARRSTLERFESRSTATPVSLAALAVGIVPASAQIGAMDATGGGNGLMAPLSPAGGMSRASFVDRSIDPAAGTEAIASVSHDDGAGGGTLPDVPSVAGSAAAGASANADAVAFIRSLGEQGGADGAGPGLSTPWNPAQPAGAGGGALPSRGGSGGGSTAPPSSAGQNGPAPGSSASTSSGASSASALLATLGLNGTATSASAGTTISRNAPAASLHGASGLVSPQTGGGGLLTPSAAFTLVTLDYNDGSVLVPGAEQLATPGGSVDLRAQVATRPRALTPIRWTTTGPHRRHQHQRLQQLRPHLPLEHLDLHGQGRVGDAHRDRPQQQPGQPDLHLLGAGGTGSATGGTTWNTQRSTPACSRPTPRRSPARTSRSSRTPAPPRPRSTCPATTPTSRRSRSITTRWRPTRCRSSSSSTRSSPSLSHPIAGVGEVDLQWHGWLDGLLQHQLATARRHHADRPPGQCDHPEHGQLRLHADDRRDPRRHADDLHLHRQRHGRKRRRRSDVLGPGRGLDGRRAWRRSSRPPAA